jgi:branched-chain amino acid aminotransferase
MLQKFDLRNQNIQVYVKDGLYSRNEAKVSVFDSVVQGGDAVWEGLRVYNGTVFCLDRHLNRLHESAKSCHFSEIPEKEAIKKAIFETLKANNMDNGVHIRLTLTRGEKITSGMDPRLNQSGCTLIVLAEWKEPVYDNEQGIKIGSVSIRRNSPDHLDSKIHHNNLLNNILAKIQSNIAGLDAALMLDSSGFVSELNGTNIFMAKNGKLYTPHASACLPGITRGLIIEIAQENNISITEKDLSLTEFYNADEVFTTGTMGELTPVTEIDGRSIENRSRTRVLSRLKSLFDEKIPVYSTPVR